MQGAMVRKIEGKPKNPQSALILPNVAPRSKVLQGVLPPTIFNRLLNFSFSFLAFREFSFLIALSSLSSKSGSFKSFWYYLRAFVFLLKKAQVSYTDLCLVKIPNIQNMNVLSQNLES